MKMYNQCSIYYYSISSRLKNGSTITSYVIVQKANTVLECLILLIKKLNMQVVMAWDREAKISLFFLDAKIRSQNTESSKG